ncbi:unnamed protein product [Gongylonema pulchrum]|uniref:MTP_lip_bd domain-containing protein n=1 Tax=Gongylonema pulchrum TaxID=637853 RepID=A0A183D4L4_9BILA|nr:unnamed protein product [Gongylonema pulchrum]
MLDFYWLFIEQFEDALSSLHRYDKDTLLQNLMVFVETRGLHSILWDDESSQTSDDALPESPWAIAQLSVLNSRMVPEILFDGYSDLLSTAWNADGQPFLIHDMNLVYRQYYGYMPLLSGLSITLDILGTLSVALFGSTKFSLWNKDGNIVVNSSVSTKLEGSIGLASGEEMIGKATTFLSATGTLRIQFYADFYAIPHLLCTAVSHSPLLIRLSSFAYY